MKIFPEEMVNNIKYRTYIEDIDSKIDEPFLGNGLTLFHASKDQFPDEVADHKAFNICNHIKNCRVYFLHMESCLDNKRFIYNFSHKPEIYCYHRFDSPELSLFNPINYHNEILKKIKKIVDTIKIGNYKGYKTEIPSIITLNIGEMIEYQSISKKDVLNLIYDIESEILGHNILLFLIDYMKEEAIYSICGSSFLINKDVDSYTINVEKNRILNNGTKIVFNIE